MKQHTIWFRKDGRTAFSAVMLGLCLLFYLFFAFYDGAVICVDSPSYINMDISREPLYCMFLAGLRAFFSRFPAGVWPADFYLTAAAFLQSLLAAFAAWSLVNYLWKTTGVSKAAALLLLCMPLAVSLLCRFAARRGSMYSNSILTEGITLPLYLLFFRFLLEYFRTESKKSLALCCALSFLMISARKQMVISLAMLAVCILIVFIRKKKLFTGAGLLLGCAILVMGGSTLLDLGYNYVVRGEAVRHSSDGRFLTTMAFYTAERDDAEYIEDEKIRELFLEIYDVCDEAGYLKHSAGEGWLNRVSHFGDSYDCIQIDTMWPAVNAFVQENYGDGTVFLSEHADQVMSVINRSVIPHNLGKILGSFLDNFLSGLITTVAQRNRILNWYSLAVYLLYLALFLWNLREESRRRSQTRHENAAQGESASGNGRLNEAGTQISALAGLTLLSILCNVGLVSLVIFCQTRYTIYNMPLFYISLILLLYNFLLVKRERMV